MKNTLLTLSFISFYICSVAQQCDYNYSSSLVLVPKVLEFSDDQLKSIEQKVLDYKICLQSQDDKDKRCWLNNSIATRLHMLDASADSIAFYAEKAFVHNEEFFCKEYIQLHVYHVREEDFPMRMHYVDVVEHDEIYKLRDFCKENYRAAKIQEYAEIDKARADEMSSENFKEDYFLALETVAEADQRERMKKELDWSIQNSLDASNRVRLDSLYSLYGFPSKEKVSKEGLTSAFMVLHHSRDCDWNEIWTRRFLEHKAQDDLGAVFAFYFERNFNSKDGSCKDNVEFWEELKAMPNMDGLLDF